MSAEFTSVAHSRARYYCKGAPVQFVQVELLRMEETGHIVVTLTFKNIAPQPLTRFCAHFRCKDSHGTVIMEDEFTYSDLQVGEGETFGADDAVYVSEVALGSVEVNLVSVEYGQTKHSLVRCQPVPLPALRAMPPQAIAAVNATLGTNSAHYVPATVADGWQCTCGAFNYNVGKGVQLCTECGANKTALYNAVRAAARPAVQQPQAATPQAVVAQPQMPAEQPVSADAFRAQTDISQTVSFTRPVSAANTQNEYYNDAHTMVMEPIRTAAPAARAAQAVSLMRESTADFIIRYVPFITLGASALYILGAVFVRLLTQ